ncbi:MAG TPA: aminoglycoside phosphotransferase family protein [Verrucomicrobiales bacterium]|nr:aminoglycoside phosphotransferase family protein [Verrucomicrobiales bacterium]
MTAPAAEIEIDEPLVRALLRAQRPDLAGLEIEIAGQGWDNVVARAGDWAIRLPRRTLGAKLIENELKWLPQIAEGLPLPVPVPVFTGSPEAGYPWKWSIARWLPGRPASTAPPADSSRAAEELAAFLAALHRPAPADAPVNRFRGVPLDERAESVRERAHALQGTIEVERVLEIWENLRTTPVWSGPAMWLHGDMHPANLLIHEGKLSAVIDFGDVTSGDPASDLAVAWTMFGKEDREVFCRTAEVHPDTWRRSAGWALNLALVFLGADEGTSMREIGKRTLRAVMEDDSYSG